MVSSYFRDIWAPGHCLIASSPRCLHDCMYVMLGILSCLILPWLVCDVLTCVCGCLFE